MKGRKVGFITRDGIFISPRRKEHKFRIYNGWGLSTEVLNLLIKKKVREIRIVVYGEKRKYPEKVLITTPDLWKQKGIPYQDKKYEPQLILRECDFLKVVE